MCADKFDFLYQFSKCNAEYAPYSLSDASHILNDAGFRTNKGDRYQIGGRGVASVISYAYERALKAHGSGGRPTLRKPS